MLRIFLLEEDSKTLNLYNKMLIICVQFQWRSLKREQQIYTRFHLKPRFAQ